MNKDSSTDIKQFIFSYIDSVEQLEVLLLLFQNPEKFWRAEDVSAELRGSEASAANRLFSLKKFGLLKNGASHDEFLYSGENSGVNDLVKELADTYRTQRHRILSLIFSPMKKARDFSDAFKIKKDEGENDS